MDSFKNLRQLTLFAIACFFAGLIACHVVPFSFVSAFSVDSAMAASPDEQSGSGKALAAHGISTFGDLKYKADFTHFDYANPDAPKGGKIAVIGTDSRQTFDSFNQFVRKGDPAQGLEYVFDSLMVRAFDEPDAVYGLVAHSARIDEDKMGVTFYLRPEARFADGSQIKASDIVFSSTILKEKGHPMYRVSLRDVENVTAVDELTVHFKFKGEQVRDLPQRVAELPVLSEAHYQKVPFEKAGLDLPLGSGPYKVGAFEQGRFVSYMRREDYWAKDLPVNKGRYNFDELRYEYFKDRGAEFEGLKAGVFDLREEFTSKDWATKYNFDAVEKGKVITATLPDKNPSGTQGFFINLRRDKFQDVRVREALGLAFDFEWTNKNLFYKLYKRTGSFFENSVFKAVGEPSAAELALLAPYKELLPAGVFGKAMSPPVSNGSGQDRKMLRKASKLLKAAGWKLKDGKRYNSKGEVLKVEFLTFSPSFARVIMPIIRNLKIIGVEAGIRNVDPAQYQERLKSFDFDLTTSRFVMRLTPGVELRNMFGSAAADQQASFNLSGVKNPAVDGLIDKISQAKNREELIVACMALDRVLRAEYIWLPHWYKTEHNVAYWNKFSGPEVKPDYARGIIDLWWYDNEKAAKLGQ